MQIYNQLDRWSLRSARRVITVCEPFRQQLVHIGVAREKIQVVHNSVAFPLRKPDAQSLLDLRSKYGLGKDDRVFLTVGRLSREKGHADLLHALHRLRTEVPQLRWKLLLAGSGPELPRLQSKAETLGLSNRLVFAGYQADVLPLYFLADFFVLPSHSEGSPHVLLEAMSAGVPILATAVGGVPELINSSMASLVRPRDPAALASALLSLLDAPQLMRERTVAARRKAELDFSHEAYWKQMLGIYRDVSGK
jgi:glycosyltransferase involved in cell wall biosynthesis